MKERAVILTAFGSTTGAREQYDSLQKKLEELHPESDFYWCYSSRVVARNLCREEKSIYSVKEQVTRLEKMGYGQIIIQSLHLFPGSEFHKICRQLQGRGVAIGASLLSSEQDYHQLADLYADKLPASMPLLFVGHGTLHPSWSGYYALEAIFRSHFSQKLWVAVVEKSPERPNLILELAKERELLVIPLFLLRGLHYRRDIWGAECSWQGKLNAAGVRCHDFSKAVIELEGVENLISRHIEEALETIFCANAQLS